MSANLGSPGSISYRDEVEGKLNAKELKKHVTLLLGLRSLKTHLNKVFLNGIIEEICADKESEWHLGPDAKKFSGECGTMIRAMMRDVSQGLAKLKGKKSEKPPQWLLPFVEVSKSEPPPEELNPSNQVGHFFFRYDPLMKLAYRWQASDKASARDYCSRMVSPDGKADENVKEVEAVWEDGVTWSVPGLTAADYTRGKSSAGATKAANQAKGESTKASTPVEWEGDDGNKGYICLKRSHAKDKHWIILWFYPEGSSKDKKQICQIVLNTLSMENQAKAIDWPKAVGMEYEKKGINTPEVKKKIEVLKKTFLNFLKSTDAPPALTPKKRTSTNTSSAPSKRPAQAEPHDVEAAETADDHEEKEEEESEDGHDDEITEPEQASVDSGAATRTAEYIPQLSDFMPPE